MHLVASLGQAHLQAAELEQVLDQGARPVDLDRDPGREPVDDLDVGLVGERLGQYPQGTDRGAQLVVDVGHEVAAHGVELAPFRRVLDHGHGATRGEPLGRQLHRPGRRAGELERLHLAATDTRRGQQLGEGAGHEDVGLEVTGEGDGAAAANDLAAGLVAHDHAHRQCVECLPQTDELLFGRVCQRQRARRGPFVVGGPRPRAQPHPNRPVM